MRSSVVYVNNKKIFTEFNMTKELKTAGEKQLEFKNSQLDTIQFLLKNAPDEATNSLLMQRFIDKKHEVEEFQNNFTQSNSEKIWGRISTYAKDFAELNGYELIIDSDGKKTVLYGEKGKDVTLPLLNYINKKYEGFQ
nr:OmpH family outer membrane protein [Flavobacterium sp. UBA7682]